MPTHVQFNRPEKAIQKHNFTKNNTQNPQNFSIEAIKAVINERDDQREDATVKAIEKLTNLLTKTLMNLVPNQPKTKRRNQRK